MPKDNPSQVPTPKNNIFPDKTNTIYDPYEGFIRGNLFADIYKPYKKEEPFPLKANTPQEKMLNKVRELAFASHELNLYLDNFPNDRNAIQLFNQYRTLKDQVTNDYEKQYGPLTVNSEALNTYPWAWVKGPWPWERR